MDMDIGDVTKTTDRDSGATQPCKDKKLARTTEAGSHDEGCPEKGIDTLDFMEKARSLGFSSEECRKLFALYGSHL